MSHYETLGVPPTATAEEITRAFRKQSKLHHPDRHHQADEETRHFHESKFKEIAAAFEVLSDPAKREYYDKHGTDSENMQLNPVESKAISIWRNFLIQVDNFTAQKTDILDAVRKDILGKIEDQREEQRVNAQKIEDFKRLLPRYVNKTGGRNPFAQVITESIKNFEKQIATSKAEENLLKETYHYLQDFDYKYDKPYSSFTTGGFLGEGHRPPSLFIER